MSDSWFLLVSGNLSGNKVFGPIQPASIVISTSLRVRPVRMRLRSIRLDASPVTPRKKCNADVYAQYPSRHYTSPSVCNSPHTEKPKRTTPDHHDLAHPLRRIRLDASSVTPRKCNADVYAQYPSRHYTSPSVYDSPHTQNHKGATLDHHNLAHPLRTLVWLCECLEFTSHYYYY